MLAPGFRKEKSSGSWIWGQLLQSVRASTFVRQAVESWKPLDNTFVNTGDKPLRGEEPGDSRLRGSQLDLSVCPAHQPGGGPAVPSYYSRNQPQ